MPVPTHASRQRSRSSYFCFFLDPITNSFDRFKAKRRNSYKLLVREDSTMRMALIDAIWRIGLNFYFCLPVYRFVCDGLSTHDALLLSLLTSTSTLARLERYARMLSENSQRQRDRQISGTLSSCRQNAARQIDTLFGMPVRRFYDVSYSFEKRFWRPATNYTLLRQMIVYLVNT